MISKNDTDIAWLAGILDGEGSIGIQNGMPRYIEFYNTSELLINKIVAVLDFNRIPYKRFEKFVKSQLINRKTVKILTVRVSRIQHMKRLSELLLPHLTCKQNKATLILNFKSRYKTTGRPSLPINNVFSIIKKFDTVSPKELATILDTNVNRTCWQLLKLEKKGLIRRKSFGIYEVIK